MVIKLVDIAETQGYEILDWNLRSGEDCMDGVNGTMKLIVDAQRHFVRGRPLGELASDITVVNLDTTAFNGIQDAESPAFWSIDPGVHWLCEALIPECIDFVIRHRSQDLFRHGLMIMGLFFWPLNVGSHFGWVCTSFWEVHTIGLYTWTPLERIVVFDKHKWESIVSFYKVFLKKGLVWLVYTSFVSEDYSFWDLEMLIKGFKIISLWFEFL